MAWYVMSGVTKMAWDVMSRVTKTAWDVLSGVANLCWMFCPGCKKLAWDVLSRDVLSGSPVDVVPRLCCRDQQSCRSACIPHILISTFVMNKNII